MNEEMYNMAMFIVGGVWTGCARDRFTQKMGAMFLKTQAKQHKRYF